ncbi:MAG TPA: hypothetical protein VKA19_05935 [Alphaproteobacteria bacterium]|nr:hypothetical protein [Alphaproteobacteria bacterium]
MARELPRKRLRERVAERKAREAEKPTTFLDHIVSSVTPGKSISYGEEDSPRTFSNAWRGYARKGGYILMALSLVLLLVQILPFVRGQPMNTNWTAVIIFTFIFLFGRALVFIAKFVK